MPPRIRKLEAPEPSGGISAESVGQQPQNMLLLLGGGSLDGKADLHELHVRVVRGALTIAVQVVRQALEAFHACHGEPLKGVDDDRKKGLVGEFVGGRERRVLKTSRDLVRLPDRVADPRVASRKSHIFGREPCGRRPDDDARMDD